MYEVKFALKKLKKTCYQFNSPLKLKQTEHVLDGDELNERNLNENTKKHKKMQKQLVMEELKRKKV